MSVMQFKSEIVHQGKVIILAHSLNSTVSLDPKRGMQILNRKTVYLAFHCVIYINL